MMLLKKIFIYITRCIALIFYPKNGNKLIDRWKFQGAWWIANSIWFQKILGFNRSAPYPMHYTTKISDYKNLVIPVSSMNNLQSPGAYYQNFAAKIILGENVFVGPNVGLITANHDLNNLASHTEGREIVIKDNSWIGMNSVILPGVVLGEKTIVGAGSVVTKSFEEGNVIIAGSPAVIIKKI